MMMTLLFYAAVSIGSLIVLLIAGCVYVALRYSDDDENEYEQYERRG